MAGNAEQAGFVLKTKKPQRGNAEASGVTTYEGNHGMNNSTNVIPFNFGKQEVRTLLINEQPWFVASDVCASLAIGNVSLAVNGRADRKNDGLDEDERGIATVNTPYGAQEMLIVSESGLYALIFKSRKAEAKRFKKWVTSEVLPSIRRSGVYFDRNDAMGDLVGAVIGSSGEVVLDRVIDQKAMSIPRSLQRSYRHTMKSRLRSRFNVQRTALIPAENLSDACNFVAAYAMEGEFLGRENQEDQLSLPIPDRLKPDERYLVAGDPQGRPVVTVIEKDAQVLRVGEFIEMLANESEPLMVHSFDLIDIIGAISKRLRNRITGPNPGRGVSKRGAA